MTTNLERINRQYRQLEKKRKALLEILDTLTDETYLQVPPFGGWSVAQVANHIYLSEKLSLAYIRKKLSYPEAVPRYHFSSWGSVLLLKVILYTPYKAKAPKAIDMRQGQATLSRKDLDTAWTALGQEMMQYLQTQEAAFGHHLVYKHPFVGRLTFLQMLIFLKDHMQHHIRQIRRIQKAL